MNEKAPNLSDVNLNMIESAKQTISSVIKKTEMEKSMSLSQLVSAEVFLKFENTQYTGSFKLRGAFNKISHLTSQERSGGVIASSAGNHAQGVAFSATKAGVKSTIVMPKHAPLVKVAATEGYGAKVILHGESYDEAYQEARRLQDLHGYTFVHPYEDPYIIAGQGTIGLEVLSVASDLDSVIVPIGGGGLISGIAIAAKSINPKIKILGVQSNQVPSMYNRKYPDTAKQIVAKPTTIADGISVKAASTEIFENFISRFVDEIVLVDDDELSEAITFLMERSKTVCEGSGAAGVAALMKNKFQSFGKKTCVILCGGNIDINIINKVIQRGLIQKGRVAEVSIIVNDMPGNLNRLTSAIAEVGGNVIDVRHDRNLRTLGLRETKIDFVLESKSHQHMQEIVAAMSVCGRLV